MNERYLQWIWSHKRLPFHLLQLTDGREVHISDVGKINLLDAGPDFKMGVVIIDGLKFVGDIELHVKSSHWFEHKHHLDSNYNAIVLHVVFECDREVTLHGEAIPTIELKSVIDFKHFSLFQKLKKNSDSLICSSQLKNIPEIYLSNMIDKALHARLLSKSQVLFEQNITNELDAYYHYLAAGFGGNRNYEGFKKLTSRIGYSELQYLDRKRVVELFLSESGIYEYHDESGSIWNQRMVRPNNSPKLRVLQFSHMMSSQEMNVSFQFMEANEIVQYFKQLFISFNHILKLEGVKGLSIGFQNHLLINSVAPFLYFLAELKYDERYRDKSIDLLLILAAEKNNITEKWSSHHKVENAYVSQGLLALNSKYCSRKKCLNCEVGNSILKQMV